MPGEAARAAAGCNRGRVRSPVSAAPASCPLSGLTLIPSGMQTGVGRGLIRIDWLPARRHC
jgi:hypothetical protein